MEELSVINLRSSKEETRTIEDVLFRIGVDLIIIIGARFAEATVEVETTEVEISRQNGHLVEVTRPGHHQEAGVGVVRKTGHHQGVAKARIGRQVAIEAVSGKTHVNEENQINPEELGSLQVGKEKPGPTHGTAAENGWLKNSVHVFILMLQQFGKAMHGELRRR